MDHVTIHEFTLIEFWYQQLLNLGISITLIFYVGLTFSLVDLNVALIVL